MIKVFICLFIHLLTGRGQQTDVNCENVPDICLNIPEYCFSEPDMSCMQYAMCQEYASCMDVDCNDIPQKCYEVPKKCLTDPDVSCVQYAICESYRKCETENTDDNIDDNIDDTEENRDDTEENRDDNEEIERGEIIGFQYYITIDICKESDLITTIDECKESMMELSIYHEFLGENDFSQGGCSSFMENEKRYFQFNSNLESTLAIYDSICKEIIYDCCISSSLKCLACKENMNETMYCEQNPTHIECSIEDDENDNEINDEDDNEDNDELNCENELTPTINILRNENTDLKKRIQHNTETEKENYNDFSNELDALYSKYDNLTKTMENKNVISNVKDVIIIFLSLFIVIFLCIIFYYKRVVYLFRLIIPNNDKHNTMNNLIIVPYNTLKTKFIKLIMYHPKYMVSGCLLIMLCTSIIGGLSTNVTVTAKLGRNAYGVDSHEITRALDSFTFGMEAMINDSVIMDQLSIRNTESPLLLVYISKDETENIFTEKNLRRMKILEDKIVNLPYWKEICWKCPKTAMDSTITDTSIPIPGCFNNSHLPSIVPRDNIENICVPPLSILNHFFATNVTISMGSYGSYQYMVMDGEGEFNTDIRGVLTELSTMLDTLFGFYFSKQFNSNFLSSYMTRSYFLLGLPLAGYKNNIINKTEQLEIVDNHLMKLKNDILDNEVEITDTDADIDYKTLYIGSSRLYSTIVLDALFSDSLLVICSCLFIFAYMCIHIKSCILPLLGLLHILLSFASAIFVSYYLLSLEYFDIINIFLIYIILCIGVGNCFIICDAWTRHEHITDFGERLKQTLSKAYSIFVTSVIIMITFLAAALSSKMIPLLSFGIMATIIVFINLIYIMIWYPSVISLYNKDIINTSISLVPVEENRHHKLNIIENVFKNKMTLFITKYKIVLIIISLVCFSYFTYIASTIQPTTKPPSIFDEDHFISVLIEYNNKFRPSIEDQLIELNFIWGLENHVNRSGYTIYDSFTKKCNYGPCGTVIYDKRFQAHKPNIQNKIIEITNKAAKSQWVRNNEVSTCFMCSLKDWCVSHNISFPIIGKKQFKIVVSNFLNEPNHKRTFIDKKLIHWNISSDTPLLWVSSQIKLNFDSSTFYSIKESQEVYDWYSDFIEKENLGQSVQMFMTTHPDTGFFFQMNMGKTLMSSSFLGVFIAIIITFIIILFFTKHFTISIIALFTIINTVFSITGTMVTLGHQLGIIEAICSILLVGFSSSFVIYYALTYVKSNGSNIDRIKNSFTEIGKSITGMCIIGIGSSLFLFFCKIPLFRTFGKFIFFTILFSYIYANFLFMSLISLIYNTNISRIRRVIINAQQSI